MRPAALALALLLAGCGGGQEARVVIGAGDEEVTVRAEVADDTAERSKGLMGRESLPEDAGMVFIHREATTGSFWMKDTLIPLSIAFWGPQGRILRILDMEPCREDPCHLYDPQTSWTHALEVNRGFFARHGIAEGHPIRLER